MKNKKIIQIIFLFSIIIIIFEVYVRTIDFSNDYKTQPVVNNTINVKTVPSIYDEIKSIDGFTIISINKVDCVYYIDVSVNMKTLQLKDMLKKLADYKVTSYEISVNECIVSGKIQIAYTT